MQQYISLDGKNFSQLSPISVGAEHWQKGMKEKTALFIVSLCAIQG